VCQSPSVSRVFSSRYSSVSTRLYPKISELFLLSNFPTAPESCPNSLKIRWKNGSVGNGSVKTAQLTAGCSVRTPATLASRPSMAQSSTHMVLRAIELDWSLLDPTPLYTQLCTRPCTRPYVVDTQSVCSRYSACMRSVCSLYAACMQLVCRSNAASV
jgi:hypothetical protein